MLDIDIYKKALKEKGLTQIQLSNLSGVTLDTIRSIFTGRVKNPRLDTIQAIEKVLEIGEFNPLTREYLTEQEEELLRSFKNLSRENKALISTICKKVELSERR